ncbi:RHS repeat domain-containing protein [Endozoicomonas euniceicola]|uniref:Teneurin-like YD-shell domain-containing protein n=1 Tax=Endozoicomonas euniceicola TaxID=1234143 RepID=A0ABY6GT57_9GAMM|nr:RHS repeat-associated core domain-containing protein [Endozoicomonas euniceicola]UYM15948.1 hypothetical protein NX720_24545 [Endozoicomonas euniceicola]
MFRTKATNVTFDFNKQIRTDARGGKIVTQYNNLGQVIAVTDPRGIKTRYEYNSDGQQIARYSPSTGKTSYRYADKGLKTYEQHENGIVVRYRYDDQSRLTKVTYRQEDQEKKRFVYTYDDCTHGAGRLCKISSRESVIKYEYTDNGQLASVKTRLRDAQRTSVIKYRYDDKDRLHQLTYPNGLKVFYDYDGLSRVQRISAEYGEQRFSIAEDIFWKLDTGQLQTINWGNGLVSDYRFNQQGLLNSLVVGNHQNLENEYDSETTNLNAILNLLDGKKSQQFDYDRLNRLTLEQQADNAIRYSYDDVGNRLLKTIHSSDANETTKYQYSSAANQLVAINQQPLSYDANGNLLEDRYGRRRFEYDVTNRITAYYKDGGLKATYIYNAMGQRIGQTKFASRNGEDQFRVIDFAYLPEGWLLSENSRKNNSDKGDTRDYIWLGSIPLAQLHTRYNRKGEVKSQSLYYLHADHLNTTRLATDSEHRVVWRWDSDAFGSEKAQQDPDGDGNKVAIPLRFPGQYYDRESGLHYNHYRDYDPSTGRYIQSDPIGLRGGLNTYAYVGGNPLKYIDPLGLFLVCRRPLEAFPGYMSSGATGTNLGIFHEHGFYEDGTGDNIGFTGSGLFDDREKADQYLCSDESYDDSTMRQAQENIADDWQDGYNMITNNCQDFMDALINEYNRIAE